MTFNAHDLQVLETALWNAIGAYEKCSRNQNFSAESREIWKRHANTAQMLRKRILQQLEGVG